MSSKLTRQDVQEILALLDSSNFDDLKIETDDFKIALRRNGAGSSQSAASSPSTFSETKPVRVADALPELRREAASAPGNSVEIKAPMFGAFFRSPKPGADPYVTIGAKVKADTTIGIIEVMKLMNPVVAGVEGEIVETPVADGDVVEFGQSLMRVRLES
jgi:acetyl-CoA carboxylase biotin carboxyl carrier protein